MLQVHVGDRYRVDWHHVIGRCVFMTYPVLMDLARVSAFILIHVSLWLGSSLLWLAWPQCLLPSTTRLDL